MTADFTKSHSGMPPGAFAWEAAGLRWLAEARGSGGAPVVEVLDVSESHLRLVRLEGVAPTAAAAEDLGRALAATHAAGAEAFGTAPPGWSGDGFFGPLGDVLPLPTGPADSWGEFWARLRIVPMTRLAAERGALEDSGVAVLHRVAARCADGAFDTGDAPARVHGDLWSGNLMWTADGATLIDPAAHGGHREADLAALALFGAPHLPRILAAYDEAAPLAEGWRERVGLHQLHLLLVHAILFGGGYAAQTVAVARRYA